MKDRRDRLQSQHALDDPTVVQAVQEYHSLLETGRRPDPDELCERFPDIAEELRACLDGLELIHAAAPQLQERGSGPISPVGAVPIGDFRVLREIGRGGMGVVYEAEQLSLGRRVALKVLPFAAVLDPRHLQRFKNEAQAAAHLHHTNIVPVYSIGSERGVHYYAMQFIDGMSVAEMIQHLRSAEGQDNLGAPAASQSALEAATGGQPPDSLGYFRAVAGLGIQAATALEHAHEEGVVHRDIKPGNLLLDSHGHLWVTDFGLAIFGKAPGVTLTGDLLGTVRYMSPEQAQPGGAPIDRRTDVYSLGITLFEMLTLEHPFPSSNARWTIEEAALRISPEPRRQNPAIPQALSTIIGKTIAGAPEDRYPTARDLAEDLQRFLDDRPIRARRPSVISRISHWSRRHRYLMRAAAAMLVLAMASLVTGVVLIAAEKSRAERNAARAQRNYARTRAFVEKTLLAVGEGMSLEPDLNTTQRGILQDALALYEEFLREPVADRAGRRELALVHDGAGWVNHVLTKHADAEKHFEDARRSLLALRDEADNPRTYLDDLATLQQHRGDLYIDMDRPEDARGAFREGLRYAEALETIDPAGSGPRHRLARLRMALGRLHERLQEDQEALESYRGARDLLDRLVFEAPKPEWKADLAECWHHLSIVLDRLGNSDGWEAAYRNAHEIAYELETQYPGVTRFRVLATDIYERWALSDIRHGRVKKYDEAPELSEEYDEDRSLVLGPEPVAFRLAGWAPEEHPVPIEGAPDLSLFHHKIKGRSNVLGEWTGEAWVYFVKCEPGMKLLSVITYRAEDGSELRVHTEGTREPSNIFKGTFLITGGTGRFEGATGSGTTRARDHLAYGVLIEQRGAIVRR